MNGLYSGQGGGPPPPAGIGSGLIAALTGASVAMLVLSALLLPVIIRRLPPDHFVRDAPSPPRTHGERIKWIARNLCGGALVLVGVALLVLPGQGLLTILVGLSWMSFPKKVAIERWIVRRLHLLPALNWIREKGHRPPLVEPPHPPPRAGA